MRNCAGLHAMQHQPVDLFVFGGASIDATLAACLLIAAAAAWAATSFGCLACDASFRAQKGWRALAIASVLVTLAPFIPGAAALMLAIVLGLHANLMAFGRLSDLQRTRKLLPILPARA